MSYCVLLSQVLSGMSQLAPVLQEKPSVLQPTALTHFAPFLGGCLAVAVLIEQAAKQSFHLCGILFWQLKGGGNLQPTNML